MAIARPIAVKLDPDIHHRMQALAESQHRSTHYLMREAIAQYVEREEKRDALRRQALAAWAEYQATGLHVTQAEAEDWLLRLETGEDAEPPECHD